MRRVEAILRCEGSRLQNEGLTLLLISLPADSTTVITTANVVKTCEMCKTKLAVGKPEVAKSATLEQRS